jgi:hypothetical protein
MPLAVLRSKPCVFTQIMGATLNLQGIGELGFDAQYLEGLRTSVCKEQRTSGRHLPPITGQLSW